MAIYPGGLRLLWPTKKQKKNLIFTKLLAITKHVVWAIYPGGLRLLWPTKKQKKNLIFTKLLAINKHVVWQSTLAGYASCGRLSKKEKFFLYFC